MTDLMLLMHEPHSASQNTFRLQPPIEEIKILRPSADLKYLTNLSALPMCGVFG